MVQNPEIGKTYLSAFVDTGFHFFHDLEKNFENVQVDLDGFDRWDIMLTMNYKTS